MTNARAPRWSEFATTFFYGLTASITCLALFVALVMVLPAAGPGLWFAVPLSLVAGMMVVHRRLPDHTYPIGLVFVPIVGGLLVLATLQVYWTILGDYL
jgi:fucose 4-O-acetylase-like acetyltransferase